MTQDDVTQRIAREAQARQATGVPPRFTGKDGNAYYYKGRRWNGPSNLVGARRLRPFREYREGSGIGPGPGRQ